MTGGSGRQHICWLIWQHTGGMVKCVVVGGKVAGGGEKRWTQQQKLKIPIQDINLYHFVLIEEIVTYVVQQQYCPHLPNCRLNLILLFGSEEISLVFSNGPL
uniref:Uncharacterized protein n=1 Tax=Wuchereria bancrofti TaxID=6293 RepID=A0A1I8EDN9_WUCBA